MKKPQESNEVLEKLMLKILTLRGTIDEEYDLLELIEDHIKEIFECDLNCSTCTDEDRGICMQSFKKANLYWIRKVAQDEEVLKDFVDKIGELYLLVEKLMGIIVQDLKSTKSKEEFDNVVDKRKEIESDKKTESSMFT